MNNIFKHLLTIALGAFMFAGITTKVGAAPYIVDQPNSCPEASAVTSLNIQTRTQVLQAGDVVVWMGGQFGSAPHDPSVILTGAALDDKTNMGPLYTMPVGGVYDTWGGRAMGYWARVTGPRTNGIGMTYTISGTGNFMSGCAVVLRGLAYGRLDEVAVTDWPIPGNYTRTAVVPNKIANEVMLAWSACAGDGGFTASNGWSLLGQPDNPLGQGIGGCPAAYKIVSTFAPQSTTLGDTLSLGGNSGGAGVIAGFY